MGSKPIVLNVEVLESRQVPATLVSPKTVTFTDIDGDAVTVRCSKGIFDDAPLDSLFHSSPSGAGEQLHTIDLTDWR